MFYDQVSKYWPIVHDYILVPDYAGIRPKLAAPPTYSHDASLSHSSSSITTSTTTINVGDATKKLDMINTGPSTSTSTITPSTGIIAKTSTTTSTTSSMTTDDTYNIPSTSDFNIYGRPQHGIPNLVCLYGIESPGLTSSLAIGNYVRDILLSDKT